MARKWVVKDDDVTSVLVGASKPQQILENLKVMEGTGFSEEEQKDGRILKGLRFKFPIYMNGRNVLGVEWDNESTDETVVLLSQLKQKPDDYINLRVATRRMDCLQGNSTTAATDLELVLSPNLPKNEDSRQP